MISITMVGIITSIISSIRPGQQRLPQPPPHVPVIYVCVYGSWDCFDLDGMLPTQSDTDYGGEERKM